MKRLTLLPLAFALALPAAAQDAFVTSGSQVTVFDADTGDATVFVAPAAGGISRVTGLAAGPDGFLYVASADTDTIARFDGGTGAYVDDFLINDDRLRSPMGLRFGPNGRLYFANRFTNEVLEADVTSGLVTATFSSDTGEIITPEDVTFDSAGLLYVASANTNRVLRIDVATEVIEEFVGAAGGLDYPHALAFNAAGDLFVASHFSDEVRRFDSAGNLIGVFASVTRPVGLAFADNGDLLVAEFGGTSVRRFDAAGTELTALTTTGSPAYVSIVNRPRILSVVRSPTSATGGCENSTVTVTLDRPAPAGGILVSTTSDNAAAVLPATLFIAEGASSAATTAVTTQVATRQVASIVGAFGASSKRTSLTVNAVGLASGTAAFTAAPTTIAGGATSTGTVLLECQPATDPVTVALSSSDATIASTPASVVVNPGTDSSNFVITTTSPAATTDVTLSATLNRVANRVVTVTQNTIISAVSFSPSTTLGGVNSTGTVTLSNPAPAGGALIQLTSADPAIVAVPVSFTIAAGSISGTFTASTTPVATDIGVQVVARFGAATKARTLFVRATGVASLTLSPGSISSNGTSLGTVTLEQAAVADVTVALGTQNAAVASPTVPSIIIPTGQISGTFTVLAAVVPVRVSTRITATANGSTKLRTIIVNP